MDSSDTFRLKATIVDHVAIQVQRAGRPGRLQRHRAAKPLVGHLAGHVHLNRNAQCQPLRRRAQRPQPVKLLLAALLSTLHGDRKRPRPGGRDAAPGPHYPSWGSETARRWLRWIRPPRTHYPSWGSETSGACRESSRASSGLITPHGDRKHVGQDGRARDYPLSLPLMGIGNARRHEPFVRFPELITPHGDRKRPPVVVDDRRQLLLHSLPLMGIGNVTCGGVQDSIISASLPLMGIGNSTCCASTFWSVSGRMTHYPSWGSETP